MDKKMLLGIPVILLLTVTVAFANGSLVNGGFETPTVTATQGWDIFDSGTSGMGWTVEWYDGSTSYGGQTRPEPAHLELHRGVNNWQPHSGDQHAELDTDWDGPGGGLNNEPASVKITQDIETTAGCEYTLTYYWSPRPGHGNNILSVFIDGENIANHSEDGSGNSNTDWHGETYTFTGDGSTVEISFIETGTPDSLGMFLDDVSITEECPTCEVTGDLTEEDDLVPDVRLGTNRWIFDGEDWITGEIPGNGRGPRKEFTIEDTYGCNCEQILNWLHENYPEEYGEMKGHWKFGCSISVMEDFIALTQLESE